MSDISIPGFSNENSAINTERVIESLLEIERIPITRIESTIGDYERQQEIWRDIGRGITQLSDNAAILFNFQNPFGDRVGVSSDERALTLAAVRGTDEGAYQLQIIQSASRDRFLSNDIAPGYRVPAGKYTFVVGAERVTLDFDGGSLRAFSAQINGINPEVITTQVLKKSENAETILFESQRYGKDNRLAFEDDALKFAQEQGVVAFKEVRKFRQEGAYTVYAQEEERIALDGDISLTDGRSLLRLTVYLEDVLQDESGQFSLQSSGSITLQNVTVPNISSFVPLSESVAEVVDNTHPTFIYAQFRDGTELPLADVAVSEEPYAQELSLPANESPLAALVLRNQNTHQTLTVSDIHINDELQSQYRPLHGIEEARDAIVNLDGIEITRSTNTISDLIPGVTLNVLAEKSDLLEIEITPDYENIQNSILGFIGSYNRLIRDLNILARNDPQIVDEIEYFSEEEREEARGRLGLLQGETTLTQLRTQLINFSQNSYPTTAEREVNLLSQIGIATNVGGFNSGAYNSARLRGYLELDESQLDTALKERFDAVKELFGNDTDQDLIVDSGVAYEIDRYADAYIQNGGVIQIRTEGLGSRIERGNEQLTTYNQRLESYEQKLRSDFGRMQGALDSLDSTTRTLENLQNQ